MLRKLRIERFKSIFEEEIEFGRANLLIGPNGSGKSNLLEALGILAAALSSGLEPVTLDLKGVRLSLPHLFKSAFKKHDLPRTFRLEATFDHGRYACSIRAGVNSALLEFSAEALYDGDSQVFGRSGHGIKLHSASEAIPKFNKDLVASTRSVWSVIEPLVEISPEFRAELDEFSRYSIYAPQTAIMRGIAIDQRVVEPLGLTGSGLATALNSVLQQHKPDELKQYLHIIWEPGWANQVRIGLFNPEIVPAQVRSEGLSLYIRDKFMRSGRDMLSTFDASEGTLYLIFVATLLAHTDTPNTFALDNVDGTLNPKLVRQLSGYLVDIVCRKTPPRQVFVTSHHPSSLDSFDIFDSEQKILICSRSGGDDGVLNGATRLRPLRPPGNTGKEEWLIKHQGRNLSELLLENRIPKAL